MGDLDRFTFAELAALEDRLYRAAMRLFAALPKATWTQEYKVARAAASEARELHHDIAEELKRRLQVTA